MRLELQSVGLSFGSNEPQFEDVDLSVEGGDLVIIEGPSGCGKSNLLRLLNRLHEPTTGQLLIDGASAVDSDTVNLRRRAILVAQTPTVRQGTVRDNLCWPFTFRVNRRWTRPTDDMLRRRLDGLLLQEVALDDESRTLSVGQRQRLALLGALLLEPEILLCDEPTASLDGASRAAVETQLETRCTAGAGVVVVTHQDITTFSTTVRRTRLHRHGLQETA
jgi:putative ABC transport system ATP-binding protein